MNDLTEKIGGVDVSRETLQKLHDYENLIVKWTKSINLIAPASVPDVWDRHIVDSVQLFQYAPPTWSDWVDIGSGGGLPGLVIAILASPAQHVTLIESDTRKCLFLNTVRRELELNVTVLNQRIEKAEVSNVDVVTARALAPLSDLLRFSLGLLNLSGTALLSKGSRFQEELDVANKNWQFDHIAHQSHTNPEARILEISRISQRES